MLKWLPFSKDNLQDSGQRNAVAISVSQCATAFSLNFVIIFMPFYIFDVSPYSQRETLLWVGAIIGLSGFCSAFASPIWGSLTHRLSPKKLYQRGQLIHAILFFLMGFTVDLHFLLILRILQGVFGGISTIGLILVSLSSSKEKMTANIGLFQSSITLGQLVGPPIGTLAVATLGYRGSFLCASALLFGAFLLCQFLVADVPKPPKPMKLAIKQPFDKLALTGWLVCLMVQIQIVFLPSILPKVLETFRIQEALALKFAGIIVMFYTIATMIGTFCWTMFAKKLGFFRLITFLLIMGIIFQSMLSFTRGVFDFTLVRMLQTGFIAAVIPLVISIFASRQKGTIIGLLNSSRFVGNGVGPMLATYMLTVSSLNVLYFLISGLTILALIGFRLVFKGEEHEY